MPLSHLTVREWFVPGQAESTIRVFVSGLSESLKADAVALLKHILRSLEDEEHVLELGEGLFRARFRMVQIFFGLTWHSWPGVTATILGGAVGPTPGATIDDDLVFDAVLGEDVRALLASLNPSDKEGATNVDAVAALQPTPEEWRHQLNTALSDLLSLVMKRLPTCELQESKEQLETVEELLHRIDAGYVRVTLFGKTNVGKSSIVNSLLGSDVFTVDRTPVRGETVNELEGINVEVDRRVHEYISLLPLYALAAHWARLPGGVSDEYGLTLAPHWNDSPVLSTQGLPLMPPREAAVESFVSDAGLGHQDLTAAFHMEFVRGVKRSLTVMAWTVREVTHVLSARPILWRIPAHDNESGVARASLCWTVDCFGAGRVVPAAVVRADVSSFLIDTWTCIAGGADATNETAGLIRPADTWGHTQDLLREHSSIIVRPSGEERLLDDDCGEFPWSSGLPLMQLPTVSLEANAGAESAFNVKGGVPNGFCNS